MAFIGINSRTILCMRWVCSARNAASFPAQCAALPFQSARPAKRQYAPWNPPAKAAPGLSLIHISRFGSFAMPAAFSDLAAASCRIIACSCPARYFSLFLALCKSRFSPVFRCFLASGGSTCRTRLRCCHNHTVYLFLCQARFRIFILNYIIYIIIILLNKT